MEKVENKIERMKMMSKLSLMQKVILKYLIEKEDGRCRIEELSWHMARIFNVEHGDTGRGL